MIKLIIDDLQKEFSLEPIPVSEELTNSFGTDVENDISILKGKAWDEVSPQDFRFHFEVLCWLTTSAFCYYLPAVIRCSLMELSRDGDLIETDLVVSSALNRLVGDSFEDIDKTDRSTWSMLTLQQMKIVRRWVEVLETAPDALPSPVELIYAIIDLRIEAVSEI